ncbi:MAG: HAMP domain-containing histidine kinase [Clostridiales bacterium]|nr:HAMP domain-containing histidine kinase [Clostridiales bacterium]
MKRKRYWRFALPRVIAALLIGAIIYSITIFAFATRYDNLIIDGFSNMGHNYEQILKGYDEGKTDEIFVSIMCNFFNADYVRLAKVGDAGHFQTIYETSYSTVPVEMDMHRWVYIISNDDVVIEGETTGEFSISFPADDPAAVTVNFDSVTVESIVEGFTIEYLESDEISDVDYVNDPYFQNAYNALWSSETLGYDVDPFYIIAEAIALDRYPTTEVKSYYKDENKLHLGEVISNDKEYDFTNPGFSDLYLSSGDGSVVVYSLQVFGNNVYPTEFFKQEGSIFAATSLNDIRDMSNPKFKEFYDYGDWYGAEYEHDGLKTQGVFKIVDINGNKYLIEYVLTTTSFFDFFKPFIIIYAIVLFVLCVGIACLAAIRPYSQYKKAYENNLFKNNLIDTLAHNLKTPLMILGGYAENLKDVSKDDETSGYADDILAKTSEMNKDIEAILKSADKTNIVLEKASVKEVFEQQAEKAGAEINIEGDTELPMDKEYFRHAIFCLVDNASKYKSEDSKIDVKIDKKAITVTNKTDADKFTPGTGIAIAGRILEQHKLKLKTKLEEGVFEARISKK